MFLQLSHAIEIQLHVTHAIEIQLHVTHAIEIPCDCFGHVVINM
jgi:hypothetical protein